MNKKTFDQQIKNQAEKDLQDFGYSLNGKLYTLYFTKEVFNSYKEELKKIPLNGKHQNAYEAYEDGEGGELTEKYDSKYKCLLPPKMASVASSSRFIVEAILKAERSSLSKLFGLKADYRLQAEYPLPFQRGGISPQLDAYLTDGSKEIFIEAKCHEIFTSYSLNFRLSYARHFEEYVKDFKRPPLNKEGEFQLPKTLLGFKEEEKIRFDAKQAIAHLLGVRKREGKDSTLLFLFYKPCEDEIYKTLESQIHSFITSSFIQQLISSHLKVLFAYEEAQKMEGLTESNYRLFEQYIPLK
ncbi:MAG: hypothetical protein LKJ88_03225 [Bacilli bacterium]|jgi:hypothetical protein|nr:hypothetical protein [Bacilli bacterium]